ncbi:hypothetical protein WMW71_12640 [Flavobacterium buctense]|uniref:Prepilin-type N-terminal cleavage/methylation domain-containing protein n=1 Tax=Flavobacterium buctense TaxID=1648146 RepID=A0ABU9E3Q3_9FLAO|nr:hypothetical protein [Flavobacterium buctense]
MSKINDNIKKQWRKSISMLELFIAIVIVIAIENPIFGIQSFSINPNDFQPVLQSFTPTVSVSADCKTGHFFPTDCRFFDQYQ